MAQFCTQVAGTSSALPLLTRDANSTGFSFAPTRSFFLSPEQRLFSGCTLRSPSPAFSGSVLKLRALRPNITCAAEAAVATESATGVAFPATFTPPGLTSELTLLGTGVREKKFAIIAVKVYAVGLYVDTATSAETWRGKTDRALFDALAEVAADKALVLTLVRDVSSAQFVNALSEELVPKLTALGADVAVVDQLSALFQGRKLKKNSAVLLAWQQPSVLQVSFVEDVQSGYKSEGAPAAIDSNPLLKSLFDLYLGEDPISPSLASSISTNAGS